MGMGTMSKTEKLWFKLAKIWSTNCVYDWAIEWHRRQHSVVTTANENTARTIQLICDMGHICAEKKNVLFFVLKLPYHWTSALLVLPMEFWMSAASMCFCAFGSVVVVAFVVHNFSVSVSFFSFLFVSLYVYQERCEHCVRVIFLDFLNMGILALIEYRPRKKKLRWEL